MARRLIANWKMQLTTPEAVSLARTIQRTALQGVQLVLCPSFPALAPVAAVLKISNRSKSSRGSRIFLGAQTMDSVVRGPITGAVSPLDLKKVGCRYVILGHSDRRKMGETNQQISTKVKLALEIGLTPILCIGETAQEHKAKRSRSVVQKQVLAVWRVLTPTQRRQVWVAYEPVWAISPGGPIEPSEAHAMVRFIWSVTRMRTPLIYGGSVTPQNAADYVDGRYCNGVLVGKASLTASSVRSLAQSLF